MTISPTELTDLQSSAGVATTFTVRAVESGGVPVALNAYLPNPPAIGPQYAIPQIAVDPTDPNAVFVAYQDLAVYPPSGGAEGDVNIYFRKLTRQSSGYWTVGNEVPVSDGSSDFVSDQFVPSIAVSSDGRIHITYYDDRDYNTAATGDQPDLPPWSSAATKMKIFYTFSEDHGDHFAPGQRLFLEQTGEGDLPIYDVQHTVVPGVFEIGEYNGLTVRPVPGGGYEIWATYTGSQATPLDEDDSTLIWASRIVWD